MKLKKQLLKLDAIENSKQLQSLEVMTQIKERPKLEQQLAELEADAAQWFSGGREAKELAAEGAAAAKELAKEAAKAAKAEEGWSTASSKKKKK